MADVTNATQLNILLIDGSTTVVVKIPAALQEMEGVSPADVTVRNIVTHRGFYNQNRDTFYPLSQIKSITFS